MDIKYKVKIICVLIIILAVIILSVYVIGAYTENDNINQIKGIFV